MFHDQTNVTAKCNPILMCVVDTIERVKASKAQFKDPKGFKKIIDSYGLAVLQPRTVAMVLFLETHP